MSLLFQPKYIGKMEVKNRFVRSPTAEKRAAQDGKCSDNLLEFYRELAEGGVGLIITGGAYVVQTGAGFPRLIGLYADDVIEGYRRLTEEVHAYDVKIAAQLHHIGRSMGVFKSGTGSGEPIAPSAVKVEQTGNIPREMIEEDIQELIAAFSQSARRAKEAGFDAVQIHACHGDLVHSFLSPYTNRRIDRWGGSFEKNIRFLLEIYEKTREVVGNDYPVLVKMNAEDYVEGGITIDLSKRMAEKISAVGFDAIEISAGTHTERQLNIARGDIPMHFISRRGKEREQEMLEAFKAIKEEVKFEEAYLRPFAKEIKQVIDIPLILPGGLRTVSVMEDVLEKGDADFIGLCRPLLRDPDFPNKVRKGLKRSDCLNCNLCLTDKPIMCYQKLYRPPHV
jgi:2,4-dienoyl-CoA reductase-like NADH-dependent reductase (Old Yellow Enzyme family)